jgi:hypothetical protein
MMQFTRFVRKPFEVEAVEITKENIIEIAKLVGEIGEKQDGTPFIQVDKEKVPNMFRVYPGDFLTTMDGSIRCYARKAFYDQFIEKAR